MNVLPDEQEIEVQQTVAQFLKTECTPALIRASELGYTGYSKELWDKFASLGWLTLCLPEDVGGQALPITYLGLLLEEVGRYIAPLPVHSTMVPALIIAKYGSPEQRALLKRVGAGDLIMSFAATGKSGVWSPDALSVKGRRDGDDMVLSGTSYFVDHFITSEKSLVAFRLLDEHTGREELAVVLVDTASKGITVEQLHPMAKDSECVVGFDGVRIPATNLVGPSGPFGQSGKSAGIINDLQNYAAVFLVSQMQGAARQAMESAVEYVNNREAFGQPIGAFQAIQHMAADMVNAVDGSQLLAREAIWRLSQGMPADAEVSQAKAFANEKCLMVCRSAQQMFGGLGFITECDINLWFRRVASWGLRCGTTYEHRARVASILLDRKGRVRLDAYLGSTSPAAA
ncbi:MAG: acyl-CoA dehydrogenase family protein [Polaromonas sp.]|uniref:acyl-CoA dehydrogenase family protein n=1 Tax=Polaromonas sp. TaxID=1869339 RepID=UPI0027324C05|nr:acyl-CoA dehydrogenase family protein [Polaromonas sp.]MDP3799024.1 acyl-CoA dehydrogenase family protein [Polaromonas sp.]